MKFLKRANGKFHIEAVRFLFMDLIMKVTECHLLITSHLYHIFLGYVSKHKSNDFSTGGGLFLRSNRPNLKINDLLIGVSPIRIKDKKVIATICPIKYANLLSVQGRVMILIEWKHPRNHRDQKMSPLKYSSPSKASLSP